MTAEAIAVQGTVSVQHPGQGHGPEKNTGPRKSEDHDPKQSANSFDDPAVQVDLSEDAQSFLVEHGKSADSTAHQARAAIGANPDLAALPFGKVVSAVAHGDDPAALLVDPDSAETSSDLVDDPEGVPSDDPAEGDGDIVLDVDDGGAVGATFTEELVDLVAPEDELPPTLEHLIADLNDFESTEIELPPTIEEAIAQLNGDDTPES